MFFEKTVDGEKWACVYEKAIRDDGSLLFPKKLSQEYLQRQRKAQGSYIFAHQYLNEIIPADDQDFKKEWLVKYEHLPKIKHTFAFVDPAISLEDVADYTAFVVVDVDTDNQWYLKVAKRVRITATQTIKLIFDLQAMFKCQRIGVEAVAYQMALMHFLDSEMRKRRVTLPVQAIKRGPDKSKLTRIRSLVPRFEWGRILIKDGLYDFEDEYLKFPRGTYVDILDALASIEEIAYPPEKPKELDIEPAPNSPDYEKWYIRKRLTEKKAADQG
jgi:phage terminase large subunit-like protein